MASAFRAIRGKRRGLLPLLSWRRLRKFPWDILRWMGRQFGRFTAGRSCIDSSARPWGWMMPGWGSLRIRKIIRRVWDPLEHGVLDYLSAAVAAAYLRQRCGAQPIPPGLPQLLHQRTSGNPLFLVAMVDALVHQQRL